MVTVKYISQKNEHFMSSKTFFGLKSTHVEHISAKCIQMQIFVSTKTKKQTNNNEKTIVQDKVNWPWNCMDQSINWIIYSLRINAGGTKLNPHIVVVKIE